MCYDVACSSEQTSFLYPDRDPEALMDFPSNSAVEYMQEPYPWNIRSSLTPEEEIRILGNTRQPKGKYVRRIVGKKYKVSKNQKDPSERLSEVLSKAKVAKTSPDEVEKNGESCVMTYEQLLRSVLRETKKKEENFPLECGSTTKDANESSGDVDQDDSGNDSGAMDDSDDSDERKFKTEGVKKMKDGIGFSETKLYSFMVNRLKESHEAYFKVPSLEVGQGIKQLFQFIYDQVSNQEEIVRLSLLEDLSRIEEEGEGHQAQHLRILRSSNRVPTVTVDDLLRCALQSDHILKLNPFLSVQSVNQITRRVFVWLKLCTLQDKMQRLIRLCENSEDLELSVKLRVIQELSVYRTWSVEQHPEWLVFEVFAQLQIRPVQHTIAKSMIDAIDTRGCNPITQLNMGEGKTRVILPMLVMHWRKSDKLVRLNFLSPLLREASDYLHSVLCASVLAIKTFHLPFSRDVVLTPERAQTLIVSLDHCRTSRGVVLVAPEHRLSLKLKQVELLHKGAVEIFQRLQQLERFNFLDVLDEVDEILRTKNKLIYALGNQEQLPSKESRWNAMQALLGTLTTSDRVKKILSKPLVCQGQVEKHGDSFPEIRLLPGDTFEDVKETLIWTLVEELVANPPFELRWLKELKPSRTYVVNYLTQPEQGTFNLPNFDDSKMNDMYALRGLLANGIFVHCLVKRNRVDYGVNRSSGRKQMAVPFHACETPSLRAEFGHPDCALMFTCLAYYYDGLDEQQVCQAFATLQRLGENAQMVIYNNWFELSKVAMDPCHMVSLDAVQKIDLTNTILVDLLVRYFRYNRLLINFWLNSCVFPLETMQFPHRLEATAWDLATNCKNQVMIKMNFIFFFFFILTYCRILY